MSIQRCTDEFEKGTTLLYTIWSLVMVREITCWRRRVETQRRIYREIQQPLIYRFFPSFP